MTKMLHIFQTSLKAYTTYKSYMLLALFLLLAVFPAKAQIVIGGNVYGGGNAGNVQGNTTVTVYSGDINKVFGGARMADVGGSTYVHLDGKDAAAEDGSNPYIIINYVYGGNDIAGKIGENDADVPTTLEHAGDNNIDRSFDTYVHVSGKTDSSGNPSANDPKIYVGQLFGGGNGDYVYKELANTPENGKTTHEIYNSPYTDGDEPIAEVVTEAGGVGFHEPELEEVYLEITGGSMVYAFGGGNKATVTKDVVIHVENPSNVVYSIIDANNPNADPNTGELLTTERTTTNMALNAVTTYATSSAYQIGSFFGGNNKVAMAIQPHWKLRNGKIRNLYSGGNEGDMTHEKGLLLEIPTESKIEVGNLYGGCRKADVHPMKDLNGDGILDNVPADDIQLAGYYFPKGLSARVLVRGGDITNVYGGNDISGDVYGGSAVGIYHSIRGNVYGGGNGSYAYTDNPALENDVTYGDFYYNPQKIFTKYNVSSEELDGLTPSQKSAKALSIFRPNSERVSLRLYGGEEADENIVIGGAVYVGGNSATLWNDRDKTRTASGELKIGSHVIAQTVFLGNNGEHMVETNERDPNDVTSREGVLRTYTRTDLTGDDSKFNSMKLTDPKTFELYMDGCSMSIRPDVVFDTDAAHGGTDPVNYQPYTSYFGSFYCGGNRGSMRHDATTTINFNYDVVIYEKLVGGSNNAYIPPTDDVNAEFDGGLLGNAGEGNPKLQFNLEELNIQPKRWKVKRDEYYKKITDTDGNYIYLDKYGHDLTTAISDFPKRVLEWNTVKVKTDDSAPEEVAPGTGGTPAPTTNDDIERRFYGGNIYGGCYQSGHVNGDVVININGAIMEIDGENGIFDTAIPLDESGNEVNTDILYGHGSYKITERRSGVILNEQGMDVLGSALNIFGGGYGKKSEIWGSTTVNLNKGYVFQIFGGGEQGAVGKHTSRDATTHDPVYDKSYNPKYSTTINLNGPVAIESVQADGTPLTRSGSDLVPLTNQQKKDLADCEFIYGGGFEGLICGDTRVYLGNGRIFNSFAGSCNADIYGHTETYIGRAIRNNELGKGLADPNNVVDAFPWVRDITYGGNDLGGEIRGAVDFIGKVNPTVKGQVYQYNSENGGSSPSTTANAYTEYYQGRADAIMGGHFGDYQYQKGDPASPEDGEYGAYKDDRPRMQNAFVNFRPSSYSNNSINRVYGGTQGNADDPGKNLMQDQSYVLINAPSGETFSHTQVFGGGDYSGIGMNVKYADAKNNGTGVAASAVVDLATGKIAAAYGGSYQQGMTRRTIVNVPAGSTIEAGSIFGGAYGLDNEKPCDVYEGHVNFRSANAHIPYIYGGNNNARRTLYGFVDIYTPTPYNHPSYGDTYSTVYGGGYGQDAWSQYTEVNLHNDAIVYEAYGGGYGGEVLNKETATKKAADKGWSLFIDSKYTDTFTGSISASTQSDEDQGGLANYLAHGNQLATDYSAKNAKYNTKYNTNVHIHEGATVKNYCYGGGYGKHLYDYKCKEAFTHTPEGGGAATSYTVDQVIHSGEWYGLTETEQKKFTPIDLGTTADISGTTYIDLLGGTVEKDLYAAGTTGKVKNLKHQYSSISDFMASANAYVKGGSVRNVYGGGWEGPVGYHEGPISRWDNLGDDILGETNVIIGYGEGTDLSLANGIPAIQRNAYGGGEGGPVFGTTHIDVYNGYIGYRYNHSLTDDAATELDERYVEETTDQTSGDIDKGGNIFGGGYVADSYVDNSRVTMWGGIIRGGLYGGGEIGSIGRGTMAADKPEGQFSNNGAKIYKYGSTQVYMYGGHVLRDVFGGGRGFSNWGNDGYNKDEDRAGKDLSSKGYIFGTTDVNVHRGIVGTQDGVALGYGNVFGGGNIGFVYGIGSKAAADDPSHNITKGYYYSSNQLTEDTRVEVKVYGRAKEQVSFPYTFAVGEIISNEMKEKLISIDEATAGTQQPTSYANNIDANNIVSTGFDANLTYEAGEYVHNRVLNTMVFNDARWNKIDQTGVKIYNAVFAGGNVSTGSDEVFAFNNTVFGNSTAAIIDTYSLDLVSVGAEGIGGLYGDGNLTYVDGYRELNVTNYGTDYFSLPGKLDLTVAADLAKYNSLTDRQKEFYVTKYQFIKDTNTDSDPAYRIYSKGDIITGEEYEKLIKDHSGRAADWIPKHSVINEGRYINTIQRCDFCGIKGSRLVLRGAMDRAQDKNEADYTNYTINRVGELSLNQYKATDIHGWSGTGDNAADKVNHGCYFGIYNVVKLLAGLTSDVDFPDVTEHTGAVRVTESGEARDKEADYGESTATYYKWKQDHLTANNRNNGSSPNKVALASGVFLELVKSNNGIDKEYGPITGVVELDLLNVTPGEGGGYVYAKNEHGAPSYDPAKRDASELSKANSGLVTNRAYSYAQASANDKMQTSGNFIHSLKRIIDDCFPTGNSIASPAHYWYIRGEFFIYDQLVSAYTGGADAYSTEISVPLTMTAQGNGRLRLLNVLPGLYANPEGMNYTANQDHIASDTIVIVSENSEKKYGQNDPISYWDWYMATKSDRAKFVMNTYVCRDELTVGNKTYHPGEGIMPDTYNTLSQTYECKTDVTIGSTSYEVGDRITKDAYDALANDNDKSKFIPLSDYFRSTNAVSHDNGFVLTVDFTNPDKWNDYYSKPSDAESVLISDQQTTRDHDVEHTLKSASFKCTEPGTYGQYYFEEGAMISETIHSMETQTVADNATETQAEFADAYVAKDEVTIGGTLYHKNAPIKPSDYAALPDSDKGYFEEAYICVSTVLVGEKDYRVLNEVIGRTEYSGYGNEIQEKFKKAYYCTKEGSWGGIYFEKGHNYSGRDYCQVLPEERVHFTYNYDALDLLVSDYSPYTTYEALKSYAENGGTSLNSGVTLFDKGLTDNGLNPRYSTPIPIDYTATFHGTDDYTSFQIKKGENFEPVSANTQLSNTQFESLPNDRLHYAAFSITGDTYKDDNDDFHVYIIKNTFDVGGVMYNAGMVISHDKYIELNDQANIDDVKITGEQVDANKVGTEYKPFFYCFIQDDFGASKPTSYTVGTKDGNVKRAVTTGESTTYESLPAQSFTDLAGNLYRNGYTVSQGTVLDYANFIKIPNYQDGFEVAGDIPIEEATLYVPVSADFDDLQEDRYVTAIYEYTYNESDNQGLSYETRVEKHIINIRIKFLSGAPVIGDIKEPELVLPLEAIAIDVPVVEEGAFPVIASGWQIFATEQEAKRHVNGREFGNGGEPMYFYENDYYIAYYAETRMGRTFSEAVPVKVGNYHRMSDVMNDDHHMYINHRRNPRNPKIYIDDRFVDEEKTYNELDALHNLWTIANGDYGTPDKTGNFGRDIRGAQGLDFILQSEVTPLRDTDWTPIGGDGTNNNPCFAGKFHGNGNTITGMNHSLFGKLCGEVYNLGVMGSFTSGGVADSGDGYVENCWVSTTRTPASSKYAVFAEPTDLNKVVNCYYEQETDQTDKFKADATGAIMPRPKADFLNGRVTYDLNRYYLEARYRLFNETPAADGDKANNMFYRLPDGTLKQELVEDVNGKQPGAEGYIQTRKNELYTVNYPAGYAWHQYQNRDVTEYNGYVEQYYRDGDFRHADGLKPRTPDMRYHNGTYSPVYPDDYIIFGQKLTYDIVKSGTIVIPHVSHPQAVAKNHTTGSGDNVNNTLSGLLINDVSNKSENRVYRAPAYFRNGTYGSSAMFNANAAFVDRYQDNDVYGGMTAIDFTGAKGDTHGYQGVVAGLKDDFKPKAEGYAPLLDYERLDGFVTQGITQNLLAYTPSPDIEGSKNTQTNNVLTSYFQDLAYREANANYRTVAKVEASTVSMVRGHVVLQLDDEIGSGKSDYEYHSANDHFLVDKQDFNAPIEYTFDSEKRMWYQRVPDNYAGQKRINDAGGHEPGTVDYVDTYTYDNGSGWEGISIPFQAELVTTQDKGELTHFYKYSDEDKGHEYWLREFKDITVSGSEAKADLSLPAATGNDNDNRVVKNTFLWDYYYYGRGPSQLDHNGDSYHEYYSGDRTYPQYPLLAEAKPYIIGFPGSRYYEFDLSGSFVPANTASTPGKLAQQTITFASNKGVKINVSDTELNDGKVKVEKGSTSYTFTPNYLGKSMQDGSYRLNADGSAYEAVTGTGTPAVYPNAVPFRPYFTVSSTGGGVKETRSIVFNNLNTQFGGEADPDQGGAANEGLLVSAKHKRIYVTSAYNSEVQVTIVNTAGAVINTFSLQPGETMETQVASGVYLVNKIKIAVK